MDDHKQLIANRMGVQELVVLPALPTLGQELES